MKVVDVLLDLYDIQQRGLHRDLDDASFDLMCWQPDPDANNISVTVWHLSRFMDLLTNDWLQGKSVDDQFWFTQGWAEKTGYDPRGLGSSGYGALTGYTLEEMRQVPVLPAAEILAYYDQCLAAFKNLLEQAPEDFLDLPAVGRDANRPAYFWVKIILVDATRHLGEIQAIKAMWTRAQQTAAASS